MVYGQEITVSSTGHSEIVNVTEDVARILKASGIRHGLVSVHVIGSTASVTTMEYEPALAADFRELLDRLVPSDKPTRHGDTWGDDNGFSHLRASLMGPGITVPVRDAELVVGTWQQIVLVDHDNRARERRLFIQIVGE